MHEHPKLWRLHHVMLVPGMLVLLMLVVRDADQPGMLVLWMVLSGMLMNLRMVPAMSDVWKAGALEAQVSIFTLFLSQI